MTKDQRPVGQLFTHVYLDRGPPTQDSILFRRRLGGYGESTLSGHLIDLASYLKTEAGLSVIKLGPVVMFEKLVIEAPLPYVLNVITFVWRFLGTRYNGEYIAEQWRGFVARVFEEENLGYSVDDRCGVHYLIDQEFEHNRVSLLRGLEASRYAGVKTAFESAHRYLDSEPRDPKAAVRAMFESVEILTKLMVDTENLNRWVVKNKLKELAQRAYAGDDTAVRTIDLVFDGLGDWVHALHNYRHGQGEPEPVAPPVGLAIFIVSSGAAFLRWLVEIDIILQSKSKS